MDAETDTMSGLVASEVGHVSALKLCKIPPCQTLWPLGNLLSLSGAGDGDGMLS